MNSGFREALQTPDFGFFACEQAWELNFLSPGGGKTAE